MNATATVLALAIQARVPAIIWGPPGIGKSKFMEALCLALDLPIETVIASIREPSDFNGLPAIMDGTVKFATPIWAQRLIAAGKGVAFFDEISTAAPAVQAGLLRVIHEGWVGDEKLPDAVARVAAANPPEQAAGGYELAAPLANRFWHGQWSLAAQDWVQGMLAGWPEPDVVRLPKDWEREIPMASARVAGFIRHRPTMLLAVPDDAAKAGQAWPSPRTWHLAMKLDAAASAAGFEQLSDVTMTAVAGCVGAGPASEYLAYLKDLDLPDPEVILKDPDKFKLPARSDRAFAALAAVAAAVIQNLTHERWSAAWKVMAKAAKDGPKDIPATASSSLLLLARKRQDLPVPAAEMRAFMPLFKAAGVLPTKIGEAP